MAFAGLLLQQVPFLGKQQRIVAADLKFIAALTESCCCDSRRLRDSRGSHRSTQIATLSSRQSIAATAPVNPAQRKPSWQRIWIRRRLSRPRTMSRSKPTPRRRKSPPLTRRPARRFRRTADTAQATAIAAVVFARPATAPELYRARHHFLSRHRGGRSRPDADGIDHRGRHRG